MLRAILLVCVCLLTPPTSARAQDDSPPPETPAQDQSVPVQPRQDQPAPDQPAQTPEIVPADTLLMGLRADEIADDLDHQPIGSLDPAVAPMLIEFSRYGSGIERIRLSGYFDDVARKKHVEIQSFFSNDRVGFAPLSLESVQIDSVSVPLQGVPDASGVERRIWKELSPGRFLARIVNAEGTPILEIERAFVLSPASHVLRVSQEVRNLTDRELRVALVAYAVSDTPQVSGYAGDRRRYRYGYLKDPSKDPSQIVRADTELRMRSDLLGRESSGLYTEPLRPYWPTRRADREGWTLSWIGQSNRYFAAAVIPLDGRTRLDAAKSVDRVLINRVVDGSNRPLMGLRLTSHALALQGSPGASSNLDFGVYLGPLSKPVINAEPAAGALALDELVVYNIGGMCAFCTFPWLTAPLTTLLTFLHDHLVFDWALSIMFLVVIVRGILHPVTRWSQIRMQRFGKQMQAIAPKQKAIQERYKDDKKRLQQEMARLWREEGISPTGMLGCLPMFLQSPVWIALYASLFYNFALRHDAAFFGAFQQLGGWAFLNDLSEPDGFIILFETGLQIPLMGAIRGINLLPILLGVVYYVHQKYLMPPPSTAMTPEMEQQQKIMRIMFPIMFPLLMYAAPSGLSLYFITNSVLGILESRWIRAHINKHDLLNIDKYKERRKRKPTLMQRLQKRIEARQRAKAMAKIEGEIPRPGMRQHSAKPQPPSPKYKKRDR